MVGLAIYAWISVRGTVHKIRFDGFSSSRLTSNQHGVPGGRKPQTCSVYRGSHVGIRWGTHLKKSTGHRDPAVQFTSGENKIIIK
jgi:hypothetical protein